MDFFERMLDRSIFFSFDRSGYRRHRKKFDPADLDRSMKGKVCLVTGANSGLGLALTHGLAARGATLHMLCRNPDRGAAALGNVIAKSRNHAVHLDPIDLSSLASVRRFADRCTAPRVDVLVHNAGLLPLEREITADGLELAVATHLVGPFLLTRLLQSRMKDARVIFVTSGGMYTKRLDVDALLSYRGPSDGVAAYAMTKRGQVVLSEQWAKELEGSMTTVNAMHPGWASTKGVEYSLPRFWKVMRKRLRTPEEGADTALWLAVAERVQGESGKLWFDRRAVSTHLLRRTRETSEERQRLWDLCESYADPGTEPTR